MKHNVLIDTNLLVLLIVGSYKSSLIGRHKNCTTFDNIDYNLLRGLIEKRKIHSLPNILTESSNLIRQIDEPDKSKLTTHMANFINNEIYVASSLAASHRAYKRLGLTDAAILQTPIDATILTFDRDLYLEAERLKYDVVYFLYYRQSISPR